MIDKAQFESVSSVLGDGTAKLVVMFEHSSREQLALAKSYLANDDPVQAADCLHRIKGSGSYLGAATLSAQCAALMKQLKSDSAPLTSDLLAGLEDCIEATTANLHRLVQEDI